MERANGQTLAEKVTEQRAAVFAAPNCQLPGCGLAVNDPIHDKRMTHGFHYFVKPNARSLSADVDGTPDEINATIDRMNRIDAAVTAESASFAAAFQMGYEDGAGDMGMTFDDDPESPRSRAYDLGRTMRRSLEGMDEPQAQESKTWTPQSAVLAALEKVFAEVASWHSVHGHGPSSVQCDSLCALMPEMRKAIREAKEPAGEDELERARR
jgi:hypothetical protein